MELDLRYRGPLPAVSDANRQVPAKHTIRRALHEQLTIFWQRDPRFSPVDPGQVQQGERRQGHFDVQRPIEGGAAGWFFYHEVRGIRFVPLITHVREAQCRLAVRLWRRQRPGDIVSRDGDLDNRPKTLFDALRMPHGGDELPQGVPIGNSPVLCLLDDDDLITKVTIETSTLLPAACGRRRLRGTGHRRRGARGDADVWDDWLAIPVNEFTDGRQPCSAPLTSKANRVDFGGCGPARCSG